MSPRPGARPTAERLREVRWQEERRAPYEAARAGGQEVRIAAALTLTDITSCDLAALIAEVEAAAQAAAENATNTKPLSG